MTREVTEPDVIEPEALEGAEEKVSVEARLHTIIREAQSECDSPNSQVSVQHKLLSDHFDALRKDDVIVRRLMARGLSYEIRAFFKHSESEGPMPVAQLDLWPKSLRQTISDINRHAVYVPSRGEYVQLAPKVIDRAEVKEAGEFLVRKGQENIRVGNQLVALSKKRWR